MHHVCHPMAGYGSIVWIKLQSIAVAGVRVGGFRFWADARGEVRFFSRKTALHSIAPYNTFACYYGLCLRAASKPCTLGGGMRAGGAPRRASRLLGACA